MFFNRFLVILETPICFEARIAGTLLLKPWFILVLQEKDKNCLEGILRYGFAYNTCENESEMGYIHITVKWWVNFVIFAKVLYIFDGYCTELKIYYFILYLF